MFYTNWLCYDTFVYDLWSFDAKDAQEALCNFNYHFDRF